MSVITMISSEYMGYNNWFMFQCAWKFTDSKFRCGFQLCHCSRLFLNCVGDLTLQLLERPCISSINCSEGKAAVPSIICALIKIVPNFNNLRPFWSLSFVHQTTPTSIPCWDPWYSSTWEITYLKWRETLQGLPWPLGTHTGHEILHLW